MMGAPWGHLKFLQKTELVRSGRFKNEKGKMSIVLLNEDFYPFDEIFLNSEVSLILQRSYILIDDNQRLVLVNSGVDTPFLPAWIAQDLISEAFFG